MLPLITVEPEEEGARRVLGFAFSRGGLDWDTLSKVLSFFLLGWGDGDDCVREGSGEGAEAGYGRGEVRAVHARAGGGAREGVQ